MLTILTSSVAIHSLRSAERRQALHPTPTTPTPATTTSTEPPTPTPLSSTTHHSHAREPSQAENLLYQDAESARARPTRVRHLIRRPVVRQWIEDGRVVREKDDREVSRFELFFDLLYVAVIHQLGKRAVRDGSFWR